MCTCIVMYEDLWVFKVKKAFVMKNYGRWGVSGLVTN